MSEDDWNTIDLILKQFGMDWSNQWSGDAKSYVVEMIGKSNDVDLIELCEHFGIEEVAKPILGSNDLSCWQEGKLRLFISHLTDERTLAADIQSALDARGISCFVAHNDISPTAEWQNEIESALSTCDLLVALIHPKFVESRWCDQEIGFALGRGVPVFTVRCGADPHGFVSRFQAFNGNGKIATIIADELFEAAIVHKKLQGRMASVLIDSFINSGTFATAKTRVGQLEKLTIWDPTIDGRLKKAVIENNQISGSWGVPARVDLLITKWTVA